jgi:hypothetical protein
MTWGDVTGYPPLRVCRKCCGRGDAHYLTCPTLQLPCECGKPITHTGFCYETAPARFDDLGVIWEQERSP